MSDPTQLAQVAIGSDQNHLGVAGQPGASLATSRSGSSLGSSSSLPSMTTSSTVSSVSAGFPQQNGQSLEALAQLIAKANMADPKLVGASKALSSITAPLVQHEQQQKLDESWKHHAQARAILGNLIGPNGEQLTSTDPYNTTVRIGHYCLIGFVHCSAGFRWGPLTADLGRDSENIFRPFCRHTLRTSIHFTTSIGINKLIGQSSGREALRVCAVRQEGRCRKGYREDARIPHRWKPNSSELGPKPM